MTPNSTATVNGTTIEERPLTEEEATRVITWQRFKEYHFAIGEDFLDQTGEGDVKVFGGWLLHKYPEYSDDILFLMNDKWSEVMTYRELDILDYDDDKDIDKLYVDFSEFCNQTTHLKKRVNQVLIQVVEHYSKGK